MFQPLCLMVQPPIIDISFFSKNLYDNFKCEVMICEKKNNVLILFTQFNNDDFFNIKKYIMNNLPLVKKTTLNYNKGVKLINIIFDESINLNFL